MSLLSPSDGKDWMDSEQTRKRTHDQSYSFEENISGKKDKQGVENEIRLLL